LYLQNFLLKNINTTDSLISSCFFIDDFCTNNYQFKQKFDLDLIYKNFSILSPKSIDVWKKLSIRYSNKIIEEKNKSVVNYKLINSLKKSYKDCLDYILLLNEDDLQILWESILFYSQKNSQLIENNFENNKKSLDLCYSLLNKNINDNLRKIALEKIISILMKSEFCDSKNLKIAKKFSNELIKLTKENDRYLIIIYI
jgi:hypothetical protein